MGSFISYSFIIIYNTFLYFDYMDNRASVVIINVVYVSSILFGVDS